MSDFKLTFTLKQHTPIIHFQHDQAGATLRATELKPKLDRFLIKELKMTEKITVEGKEKEVPKEEFKSWFINQGKKHLALDYKVRVNTISKQKYYVPYNIYLNNNKKRNAENVINRHIGVETTFLTPSPYFGNSDKIKFTPRTDNFDINRSKIDELLIATQAEENINVTIHSFNTSLKRDIEENIVVFFLLNNFGTRQNKGFGSYTVFDINKQKVSSDFIYSKINQYFFKKQSVQNINQVFSVITEEYQLLKSGINLSFGRNPVYKKSSLFKYFIKENIRWEKRFIKQKLNSNGVLLKQQTRNKYEPIDFNERNDSFYNSFTDVQTNDYKYIRALLGLAENYEFATYNRGRLKVKVKHRHQNEEEIIERFKSPVFFKVINNNIYITYDETYKSIENKEFDFYDNNNLLGTLRVPRNFDLKDFLNKHLSDNWKNI